MTRHAIPTFAAFPYYPKGTADTQEKERLQNILYAIKDGVELVRDGLKVSATRAISDIILAEIRDQAKDYFNPEVALVPLPRSTTLGLLPASQWPCLEIAQYLAAGGCGTAISAVLRKTAVGTSHRLPADQRPSVETIAASVEVDFDSLKNFDSVTLLDDVVTTGTNAVGVAVALERGGYRGHVRLFSAAHTVGKSGGSEGNYIGECVWLTDRPRAFRPS